MSHHEWPYVLAHSLVSQEVRIESIWMSTIQHLTLNRTIVEHYIIHETAQQLLVWQELLQTDEAVQELFMRIDNDFREDSDSPYTLRRDLPGNKPDYVTPYRLCLSRALYWQDPGRVVPIAQGLKTLLGPDLALMVLRWLYGPDPKLKELLANVS